MPGSVEGSSVSFPRGSELALLCCCSSLPPRSVHAHPADMYAQNRSIAVAAEALRIDWQIVARPVSGGRRLGRCGHRPRRFHLLPSGRHLGHAPFVSDLTVPARRAGRSLAPRRPECDWPRRSMSCGPPKTESQITLRFAWPTNTGGRRAVSIHSALPRSQSPELVLSDCRSQAFPFNQPQQDNGPSAYQTMASP